MSFATKLMAWYQTNGRDLPWRNTNDPYVIWLSEIILQQTRVEQGLPYFNRFLSAYPDVVAFAEADEADILRLWQGLGYYSRARNMHKAAKTVVATFGGRFPVRYDEVITLSGVGEYTAAAIASFSSNEAKAVVDGNVYRVLSRYFGIDVPINSSGGKKVFATLAQEMLAVEQAAIYNQAIMDFGAMQCKPKGALCETCIFRLECVAYRDAQVTTLPVKLKGKTSRNRYFHYFLIIKDDAIMMAQRGEGDVWTNLFEFPMLETQEDLDLGQLYDNELFGHYFERDVILEPIGQTIKHVLSHQNIYARFYVVDNASKVKNKKTEWNYYLLEKIDKLAKHKLIFAFLEKNRQLINLKL